MTQHIFAVELELVLVVTVTSDKSRPPFLSSIMQLITLCNAFFLFCRWLRWNELLAQDRTLRPWHELLAGSSEYVVRQEWSRRRRYSWTVLKVSCPFYCYLPLFSCNPAPFLSYALGNTCAWVLLTSWLCCLSVERSASCMPFYNN